jgi:peptidoglycan/xylan/chitin deacetylase (PgdA/CDA1 family)
VIKIIISCIGIILSNHTLLANEIAFTIDDAPKGDELIYTGLERTSRMIDILKRHNIQAVFFANSERMQRFEGKKRIQAYSDAGHLIANHTHSHPNPRKISLSEYLNDIDRAHEQLKSFPTYTMWFRYPYLNEGPTIEYRDGIREHLKTLGYSNGYVTVDNYDYFINDLVQTALKKGEKPDFEKACAMLTDLMWDGIELYSSLARKHLGQVRHTLLMHENDLEALCLEKLIFSIQRRGWKIISPTRAFQDPLLAKQEPDTLYLNQGRVAAMVHVKTGIKHISKWESEKALRDEFKRRQIVESSRHQRQ